MRTKRAREPQVSTEVPRAGGGRWRRGLGRTSVTFDVLVLTFSGSVRSLQFENNVQRAPSRPGNTVVFLVFISGGSHANTPVPLCSPGSRIWP